MTATPSHGVHLESSVLAAVAYDPGIAKLELRFGDGSRYLYSAVPPEIVHELLCAASKGRVL